MSKKERIMQVGDTVRNKETGSLATVKYSSFGVKIGGFNEDGSYWKTYGCPPEELAEYWEVVNEEL